MSTYQKLLEWGHSYLKVPYTRLAEEITAAGKGNRSSEQIKLLFFPFKTAASVAVNASNHFYPPLMDSPVVNAVMLVTEQTKKGILRIYTEEYNIGTLSEDLANTGATMFVKDYKPVLSKVEILESLMQKGNYQGILDFMGREKGQSWNCLKIGSIKMLEEMKLIEDTSNETKDFLAFFFQTLQSLQNLYNTGDFYVFPEDKFPLFYFWQNYFSKWTGNIDYNSLKLLISQLFENRNFNILIEARGRPLFNLLININNGKMSIEMAPAQKPFDNSFNKEMVRTRRWDSVRSVAMLKNLMNSNSLKELILNSIPYFANLALPRKSKKKKAKNDKTKKSPMVFGLIPQNDIENILLEFTSDLNDGDKTWTVFLDNITPLFGFESEIKEGFPAQIIGLNERELKAALKLAIPSNNIKMKILLDYNHLTKLRTEIIKGDIPERLKKIEKFFLQGMKIYPEPALIENIASKGILTTLYRLMTKKKKKR